MSGSIGLIRLERLQEYLAGDEADIWAAISFTLDDSGRKHITGSIKAKLRVECQRCLEPLSIDLLEEFNLILVADEAAAKDLEKQFDPWIIEDNKIFLADVIDEQLVLSMPIVNYHHSGPCAELTGHKSDADETEVAKATNPFAVLASLKKQ